MATQNEIKMNMRIKGLEDRIKKLEDFMKLKKKQQIANPLDSASQNIINSIIT